MADSQFCSNHPIAAAIDVCIVCSTPLCGMCASFSDSGVYCENCFEHHENEQSVMARTAQFEEITATSTEVDIESDQPDSNESSINWNYVRAVFISFSVLVIAYQLYVYNQPIRIPTSPQLIVRERAVINLVQCLTVFADIGIRLSQGETPDGSMICSDSLLANRITEDDGVIKVSHPNPKVYDLKEIFVTSSDPKPATVSYEQD